MNILCGILCNTNQYVVTTTASDDKDVENAGEVEQPVPDKETVQVTPGGLHSGHEPGGPLHGGQEGGGQPEHQHGSQL